MVDGFPPEVADAHARLSLHHARFVEFVRGRSSWLKRSAYRLLERGDPLAPFPLQSWPLLVDRDRRRRMGRLASGLMDLIRKLPERFFAGDAGRMAAFYGLESTAHAELLLASPNGIESAIARGDFVLGPDGLRCLEMNVTGHLGGWQSPVWAGRYLQLPMVVQFLAQHGLSSHGLSLHCPEPLPALFEHMAERAALRGRTDRLRIAFLVSSEELARTRAMADFVEQQARRTSEHLGLPVRTVFCSSSQLVNRGAALEVDGWGEVDAVLEAHEEETPAVVFRPFKARSLDLYNGPIRRILGDKRNLALLSNEGSDIFSDVERQLIREVVPWTCQVRDQAAMNRDGQKVDLLEWIRRDRERLVLKKAVSGQGADVLLGHRCDPSAWDRTLERALAEEDWVAQEFVPSIPVALQAGDRGWCVHDIVWGLFVFGARDAGGFVSAHPREASGGVVNVHRGARSGVFFEVRADSSADAAGSGPGV